MGSSGNVDNRKKDILILGKGPAQGLDDTALTAEKKYAINVSEQQKKFCYDYYNCANIYFFINDVKIYKFKAKDSETNAAQLCLGTVSKDFSTNNLEKTRLYRYVYDFSVDFNCNDADDILDIHKYLIKKHDIKQCFDLSKKMFIGLLSSCIIESLGESLVSNLNRPIKCISLNNQTGKGRPALVSINSDGTLFYSFTVSVSTYGGSCNSIDDSYAGVSVPNKVKNIFNLMSEVSETIFLVQQCM